MSWGPPEVIAKRSGLSFPQTQPAGEGDGSAAKTRLTMQELVKNQLDARRQVFEARALRAFKAREYHEACDLLVMADASVLDDWERRIRMKMLFIFAAIAAEQYQEAANALGWILGRDVGTGADFIPGTLNQFRDVASFYSQPQDFNEHAIKLDVFINGPLIQGSPLAPALKAIMAWGENDPANAKFYARQLVDEVKKDIETNKSLANNPLAMAWLRLFDYMQLADPTGQPVTMGIPSSQPETTRAGQTENRPEIARPNSLTVRAVPESTE